MTVAEPSFGDDLRAGFYVSKDRDVAGDRKGLSGADRSSKNGELPVALRPIIIYQNGFPTSPSPR